MYVGQIFDINDRCEKQEKSHQNEKTLWSNTGFSRDLSRIVFSNAYKRMAGKTQIFPAGYSDHYMTRLTHTLIVNNIAVDIATRINLVVEDANINVDLIQAIANGHDVGHTPFGHAGERELLHLSSNQKDLNSISCKNNHINFHKPSYFKHNIFSVGVLQCLERVKNFDYGYDLTWQTIDGILKHTDLTYNEGLTKYFELKIKNKLLLSPTLLSAIRSINEDIASYLQYPYPLTIEGQIVKIADEIAQYYHDVLDCSRFIEHKTDEQDPISTILSAGHKNDDCNKEYVYVQKFINTYFKDGKIRDQKIFNPENRESFANDFKELFINDVVYSMQKSLSINENNVVIYIDGEKKRKIIKNILFTQNEKGKVVPTFVSPYVSFVSKTFVDYRSDILKSPQISKFDIQGTLLIDFITDQILTNESEFVKHCGKDILHNVSTMLIDSKISLSYEGKVINPRDMYRLNKKSNEFASATYRYVMGDLNEEPKIVFYSEDEKNIKEKISDLFYGTIIETVGRMTDNYIWKLFSPKQNI